MSSLHSGGSVTTLRARYTFVGDELMEDVWVESDDHSVP